VPALADAPEDGHVHQAGGDLVQLRRLERRRWW
jgi:hypothetical protein